MVEEVGEDRVLTHDEGWKRIQQNTFTRWCNEHLRKVDQRLDDLETDLSDGLLLIQLVQVLSHKRLPRWNKKPNFVRRHSLETQKLQSLELISAVAEAGERVDGAVFPARGGGDPDRQHR